MNARPSNLSALDGLLRFKALYDSLDRHTLSLTKLKEVYSDHIEFEDSLHRIEGIEAMHVYFQNMYENVERIEFQWQDQAFAEDAAFVCWIMRFQHPKLKGGREIAVSGVSHLHFAEGKLVSHRDYFDAGEMLYEHVPALGAVIRTIKKRVA